METPARCTVPDPSPWVAAALGRLDETDAPGRALDLACGSGRHTRLALARGERVLAVDRDVSALAGLAGHPRLEILKLDLEDGTPWPFAGERFRAVVVANYLHRPTLARTIGLVAPGGLLVYETFGTGNERLGRPRNPDFLARPHEIATAAAAQGLEVLADEHAEVAAPRPMVVHRALARRPAT